MQGNSRIIGRRERRLLEKESAKYPIYLVKVARHAWAQDPQDNLVEVWRSRGFLVQIFQEENNIQRISVCRTMHNGESWVDQITWEELMRLKRECGRGNDDAVEVFPADRDIVNVANMRHLWVMPVSLAFIWRK